ncbi:hypothetical protein BN2127_JRS3_03822 [Bacillus safensis]|uniref:hypothetical protein n=1 Tax=Bacillus safensis TaxID=561879 RepID=UPI0006A8B987|nr:hypothetical protein [Bacillus safensis]CUB24437.1 hypothetical protein BN2127_JRS3_03822 [Bacillus safensis]
MRVISDKNIAVMNVIGGVEIAWVIAEALASFAAQKLMQDMINTDPEDVSQKTLKLIADMIHQEIEAGRQRDYEALLAASVDKFFLYEKTKQEYLLQDIVTSNLNAMSGLREIGPGAILAWIMGVQYVLTAYVIWREEDRTQTIIVKDMAERYAPIARKFLKEAIEYNSTRVGPVYCEYIPETVMWKCCYTVDGHERGCRTYKKKSRARSRAQSEADEVQRQLNETNNVLLFKPIEEIINKWDDIVISVNKMIQDGTINP